VGVKREQIKPGILRFHGGYPAQYDIRHNLIGFSVTHRQRVISSSKRYYKTQCECSNLIASADLSLGFLALELSTTEWNEIQQIWEKSSRKWDWFARLVQGMVL
jgi:hypothetical protein